MRLFQAIGELNEEDDEFMDRKGRGVVEFARSLIEDAVSDGMPTLGLPRMRIGVWTCLRQK